nr:MAG TPA: hypothetical protein [Caudoviricetes sp.]
MSVLENFFRIQLSKVSRFDKLCAANLSKSIQSTKDYSTKKYWINY